MQEYNDYDEGNNKLLLILLSWHDHCCFLYKSIFQRFAGSQTLLSNAERYGLYLARATRSINETEQAVVVSRDNIGKNY